MSKDNKFEYYWFITKNNRPFTIIDNHEKFEETCGCKINEWKATDGGFTTITGEKNGDIYKGELYKNNCPQWNVKLFKKDDHVMNIEEFIDCCESRGFIDYDGFAIPANKHGEYDVDYDEWVRPSTVVSGLYEPNYTHIVWYNR